MQEQAAPPGARPAPTAAAAPPAAAIEDDAAAAALKERQQQQEATAAKQQRLAQQRQQQEAAAAAEAHLARLEAERRRRASPLYRVTPNEAIVHEMLLSGREGGLDFLEPAEPAGGAPARLAAGRRSPAGAASAGDTAAGGEAGPLPGAEEATAAAEARQAVVATVERAFFDALAEGLRRGNTAALASLLLDSRDQLAALLPQHPPPGSSSGGSSSSGGEGHQLLAELREQLDSVRALLAARGRWLRAGTNRMHRRPARPTPTLPTPPPWSQAYVEQRLRGWDARFAAQAFDSLVHVIARLQVGRRDQTEIKNENLNLSLPGMHAQ